MEIKVVLAATNAAGEPDFFIVKVRCSKYQYSSGEHYDAAREAAANEEYESPMVAFDEKDGPTWLFKRFEWDTAEIEDITLESEDEDGDGESREFERDDG